MLLWLFLVRKDGEFILHIRYFRMLGFDCFFTNFLFPARWSPYSSQCGGTSRDWYLSFPGHTMRYSCDVTWGHLMTCFAFRNLSSVSYFQMQFSLMDQLHEHEFTSLLIDVPLDVMWAHLHSCASPTSRAWLLACFNTFSFCLSFVHFFIALHVRLGISHPTILHFS